MAEEWEWAKCAVCDENNFHICTLNGSLGYRCKNNHPWEPPRKQYSDGDIPEKWPFGKYKGVSTADIPDDYFEYMIKSFDDGSLKELAQKILDERSG